MRNRYEKQKNYTDDNEIERLSSSPPPAAPSSSSSSDVAGGAYLPLPFALVWEDKADFLRLVHRVEESLRPPLDLHDSHIDRERENVETTSTKTKITNIGGKNSGIQPFWHTSFIQYRGLARSRLEPDVFVGSGEFQVQVNQVDRQPHPQPQDEIAAKSTSRTSSSATSSSNRRIAWPVGYATHYIGKWNVMPTKRFFDFICHEGERLADNDAKANEERRSSVENHSDERDVASQNGDNGNNPQSPDARQSPREAVEKVRPPPEFSPPVPLNRGWRGAEGYWDQLGS
ncbi:unnamed protein product [Amoebophrya sp. A25]|nr:unnamed protein product [Amoebophrya sp. A25]|eukprot:GSA25T00000559001.1